MFKKYDLDKFYAKPDETLLTHTQKVVAAAEKLIELGYVNQDLISDLLYTCFCHDLGKMNPRFQYRIGEYITKNKRIKFDSETEYPHGVLSVLFIDEAECSDYQSVCFSVLYHHYRKNSGYSEHIIDSFDRLQDDLKGFDYPLTNISSARVLAMNLSKTLSRNFDKAKQRTVLLKGLLHKCDYSASGNVVCEFPNDFLLDKIESWQSKNNIVLNDLQSFCRQNSNDNIIVTAPTGMGKTEAGLLWCGNNKCFFVLPLKTAINAMYDRMVSLVNDGKNDKYKERVALIHSDIKEIYLQEGNDENTDFDFAYFNASKQLSLPLTVCTPDQIFDFVLKYPCYEYKLAVASYSRFIIDEIQMYSPDLLAAIIYAIKLIHLSGGKIAVLTATLPPFVREELTKALGNDFKTADFSSKGKSRHNVTVIEEIMKAESIWNKIQSIKSEENRKFLVVCNSIDTATKIFNALDELCCDSEIELNMFHAGFIKKDRAEKEAKILSASNSENRGRTEIWVSTSVVEASLDIDFDILFTELSDLFSLFQRFGRVNRKGMKGYFKTNPNCFVYTELQGNAKKYNFTDPIIYGQSKAGIQTVCGIISEQEKSALIDEYLSTKKLRRSQYIKNYRNALNCFENAYDYVGVKDDFRTIDRRDVIPRPVYDNTENREVIENALNILNDASVSKEDKLKAKLAITQLTVSVSKYHIESSSKRLPTKFGSEMGIPILDNCEYDSRLGIRITKSKTENEIDRFI